MELLAERRQGVGRVEVFVILSCRHLAVSLP
jgi:hypothetical protein